MPDGADHIRVPQLVSRAARSFRLGSGTLTQIDPVGLRYVANMLAWAHWPLGEFVVVQLLYRPLYGYWAPQFVAYLLILLLIMMVRPDPDGP